MLSVLFLANYGVLGDEDISKKKGMVSLGANSVSEHFLKIIICNKSYCSCGLGAFTLGSGVLLGLLPSHSLAPR